MKAIKVKADISALKKVKKELQELNKQADALQQKVKRLKNPSCIVERVWYYQ